MSAPSVEFKVVRDAEGQYSIWPVDRSNAIGWGDVGVRGSKEICLAHIETVWTDMRPVSIRGRAEP